MLLLQRTRPRGLPRWKEQLEETFMLLEVKDLCAKTIDRQILNHLNFEVSPGEVHVIMGPNGAGKSTLGCTIMGDPRYEVCNGKILFKGEDVTGEGPDKRAKMGMFLSFQNPVEVPGITLSNFIRTAVGNRTGKRARAFQFKKDLEETMKILDMNPEYANRDLNVGFSGGEKKKAEILQLLMIKPDLAILDETDSGLDVDAVRIVSAGIEEYKKQVGGALIIITHSTRILESLAVDKTHILVDGSIVDSGDATLVDIVNEEGFERWQK